LLAIKTLNSPNQLLKHIFMRDELRRQITEHLQRFLGGCGIGMEGDAALVVEFNRKEEPLVPFKLKEFLDGAQYEVMETGIFFDC